MTAPALAIAAGAGSALLLAAALGFQAGGYAPCELCVLQRWPHVAAAGVAGLVWLLGRRGGGRLRALALLGALAALVASGLGVHHAGVELGWWQGPSQCSGTVGDFARMSAAELMTRLQSAPVVRCDEIAWSFLGLSMAGWNAALSAGLAGVWLLAARRAR